MGIDGVGSKAAPTTVSGTVEPKKVEAPPPPPPPASAPGVGAKISEGFDAFKKKLMSTTGKYVAHQVAVPDRPDLKDEVANLRSQSSASDGNFMRTSLTTTNASAERELPPVGKNEKVDLSNKEMRNQLLRAAPQVNDISNKAGNSGDVCGGAAMANALVMTSDTPEKGKANADAVRKLAASLPGGQKALIKPEEEKALKAMESGKMTPTDVMHLQQTMYRLEEQMPSMTENPSGRGRSTAQVGCALTMLKGHGAFPGDSDIKLHNVTNDKGFGHWTVTVDGIHADSNGGIKGDKSIVTGGPPPEVHLRNPKANNEIALYNSEKPAKVYTQFKQPGDTGYREAVFDPAAHMDEGGRLKFDQGMRKGAAAPQHPID